MLQDKRFKNRELQIMKMVDHPNIVKLRHCFYSHTEKDETYLHLVLEYVPDTVYRISKHYAKNNQRMPNIFVKLYAYQMCRALGNIHHQGICHRDIKPQNLLVNTETHQLKLCDFGSAKVNFGLVVGTNTCTNKGCLVVLCVLHWAHVVSCVVVSYGDTCLIIAGAHQG